MKYRNYFSEVNYHYVGMILCAGQWKYELAYERLTQYAPVNNMHQNDTKYFEFSTVGKPNEVNRRPD